MKRFISTVILLMFVIVASSFLLDSMYTKLHHTKTPRSKASFLLQNKVAGYDYIFLGSSRVYNHINPEIIYEKTGKRAINLGVQGAILNDYELFLEIISENNIEFERIFVQVDYVFNLFNFNDVSGVDVIPFMNSSKAVEHHLKKYNESYSIYKSVPFYRYMKNDFAIGFRESLMLLSERKSKVDFSNGFDPKHIRGVDMATGLPSKIVKKNPIFNRIDSIASLQNINITYFTAPFCSNTKNIEYIDSLALKVPNLRDYSRSILDDKYFYNCSQLNIDGANLFTEIIIEDLQL